MLLTLKSGHLQTSLGSIQPRDVQKDHGYLQLPMKQTPDSLNLLVSMRTLCCQLLFKAPAGKVEVFLGAFLHKVTFSQRPRNF
jgi:hypothetical protein